MKILFVIAAIFTFTNAAGYDWRIVGGSEARQGQFPYTVLIKKHGSHTCGGSILNKRWILTAAHCVDRDFRSITVVAGTNSLSSGGDTYNVLKAFIHEDFNRDKGKNDIALVKLTSDIVFNRNVQSIKLNTEEIGEKEKLTLSGWGITSYPGNSLDKLQYIDLFSISTSECDAIYKSTRGHIDDNQICTYTKKGQGACKGDSGGPLVYKGKVAGIASWVELCAIGYPDVFTRVSKFANWVKKHMHDE